MGDPLTAAPACTDEELNTRPSPVTNITIPSRFFNNPAGLSEKGAFPEGTHKAGQYPAHDADQDRADHSPPKAVDVKSPYHSRHQPKKQTIDDQQKDPEGHKGQGEGEQDQEGSDKRIDHPEEKGGDQGRHPAIHPYHLRQEIGDDQDGHHIDQETNDEVHESSPMRWFLARARRCPSTVHATGPRTWPSVGCPKEGHTVYAARLPDIQISDDVGETITLLSFSSIAPSLEQR